VRRHVNLRFRFSSFEFRFSLFTFLAALLAGPAARQARAGLAERIQAIASRPEFRHAMFGVESYDLAAGKVVYELNGDKLFTPASTCAALMEGG